VSGKLERFKEMMRWDGKKIIVLPLLSGVGLVFLRMMSVKWSGQHRRVK
jgi:hypothetical protein